MAIQIQQSRDTGAQLPQGRYHPKRDRAVTAEDQSKVAASQQRPEPPSQLLRRRSRLAGVLGHRVIPVRVPYLLRQVPSSCTSSPDPLSCSIRPAERNAAGARSWPAA